ncbi:Imm1 family immunity protein [Kitasatospora sp. NPDC059811]|uniref:Imm1 family immunity protein n=1 Tax=Streptomycetaceae TaxID=2062 RepID=UPI0007AF089F|nr:Imm1 family immunity protein [Streptomyces sp. MJM8645]
MILRITYGDDRAFPATQAEISQAIADAIEYSSSENEPVSFVLIEAPAKFPAAYLRASVSADRACGALIWFASEHLLDKGGIYSSIWISENPEPPTVDPDVIADAYTGRRHDPASTIPIHRIVAAIEEYCMAGTGERPCCIEWVTGEPNGQRHDRPIIED